MLKTQINRLLLVVILLNIATIIGCHRSYYRRQADAEARRLIHEKSQDPRWDSASGTIDVDPMSRMFNPFSEDHVPIPPDDAASHQFMHCVDGKEGYPHWHANGDTNYVEAPEWMNYLPMNEKGQVVLTLERAYELALLHSPDLQQQRERLYLSALNVSLERFGFDTQLFTGFNSFFTTQGRLRNGASSSTFQTQLGANGGGLDLRRAGITGANFVVGLANTILFNFAGNNTQSATSLIDFSVIQPLLRGAGRDRIMESLTQAERDLLANVRQLERFRRGFYLEIAIGRNAGIGVSNNLLSTPGSASANSGGFFGLLETQQQIRNQEFNVRQLEAVLEQFTEFFLRERLDALQLKQFETNFYRQQRSLLILKTNYQTALDQFKISLGLPPDLDVLIDDSYLDRFELISDQINERLINIAELRKNTGTALNRVDSLFDARAEDDFEWESFEWPEDLAKRVENLTPFVENAVKTLDKIANEDRVEIEADLDKLESTREDRIAYLKTVLEDIESGRIISSVNPDLFKADSIVEADFLRQQLSDPRVDELEFVMVDGVRETPSRSILKRVQLLKDELNKVLERVQDFENAESSLSKTPRPDQIDPELYDYILTQFQQPIPGLLSELNNLTLEMSLLQAQARSNSIEINDVSLDAEHAIRIAKCLRRDWMNARAGLVDEWRNIEFVADQLEAQVDLVFEGDIGNNGDNPFKIRYETGQLRAGFRFDAPIVRMAERNNYRGALINFQQTRRNFYQFEDSIKQNIRQIIRLIDRNKVSFELDRVTVLIDIQNVEINRYELERPVGSNQNANLGSVTSRNLTDSIINLNGSQNAFLRSWVQLEVLRRNLDFDLGTMQLDEMGQWVDPGAIDDSIGIRTAQMLGIELDCQFCENIDTSYSTEVVSESVIESTPDPNDPNDSIAPGEPDLQLDGSTPEPIESLEKSPTLQAPSSETSSYRTQRNRLINSRLKENQNSRPSERITSPILVKPGDLSAARLKAKREALAKNREPVPSSKAATTAASPAKSSQNLTAKIDPPVIKANLSGLKSSSLAATPKTQPGFSQPDVRDLIDSVSSSLAKSALKPAEAAKVRGPVASVQPEAQVQTKPKTPVVARTPVPASAKPQVVTASAVKEPNTKEMVAVPTIVPESKVQQAKINSQPEERRLDMRSLASSSIQLLKPNEIPAAATKRIAPEKSVPQKPVVETKRISASQVEISSMPKLVVSMDAQKPSTSPSPQPKFRTPSLLDFGTVTSAPMKPLPLLKRPDPKTAEPAPSNTPPKEPFKWETEPESFGGLLNRFKSTRAK